ncbi:MAG TPA: hypothetical protein PK413_12655, partial [Thermoanaerobaculia bacterium]|nr:hypothetical protein [Thermoanaerobaculia bacterium]
MSRAALALLALLAAPAARGALAEGLCQPSAALSFFGADNRDGRVYFSLDDGSGNLVLLSLPPQNDTAPRLPIAQGAGLFAGSAGS